MAEWTRDDVRSTAPEFIPVPDATLDSYIAQAETIVSPCAFGARISWAGALMTAHLLTLYPPTGITPAAGAPGPIQSQTVGSVSVTYAVPMPATIGLTYGETKYGRLYAQLVRLSVPGPQVL